ncbi:MAG: HAMP domain-containing protein [Deltaproteobacteria bacterium]|nr:HAMP domain-containing protein [Deltaproteobacteria bacterium]
MGIAMRIAMLSWLVSLTTLISFVFLVSPYQKRMFLQSLEARANSVAVFLQESSGSAAVQEDFASVVTAGQTMLERDRGIDFLIIMKNDGYSLVLEQTQWRVLNEIELDGGSDLFWRPAERKAQGSIRIVPRFKRRVFHYAQPFNYLGVEWGWIHIGLSLAEYDRSLAILYRNTVILALACIGFSLLVSLLYARQLVQPILRLRHIVERIAGGDLSVRAERVKQDELGSLAGSVNIMAEALLRRDRILESVRFAAQQFMQTSQWEEAISAVLEKIGRAADAGRAYLFQNHTDPEGRLCMSLRYGWTAEKFMTSFPMTDWENLPYDSRGLETCHALLSRNEILPLSLSQVNDFFRPQLEALQVRSMILIPVFAEGAWWGFMGLNDCQQERVWTDAEKDSLRAGADMLGATIARQRIQDALVEAKATLEQRVEERTLELKEQVTAKEQALTELAAVQGSLLAASRAAGMAEVATGVLHNVGNVLNSVNVSCTLMRDRILQSRVQNLSKITALLTQHQEELSRFLSEDSQGRQVLPYLFALAPALEEERQLLLKESETLRERVDHIKEIVAMQQSYGRVSGVMEAISPVQLMEDALKLNAGALARHEITVVRDYQSLPAVLVEKHRVLQILLNLIGNAKNACIEEDGMEKTITLRIDAPTLERFRMQVADTGKGISPENLTRIFQHGFTTRKGGHGFGLHSGALAAKELGGSLSAHSAGLGAGATFTLELPCRTGDRT